MRKIRKNCFKRFESPHFRTSQCDVLANIVFLGCHVVLPAGAADVARSSAAEACAAVLPGSTGGLHGADPHLRLQAPPIRRAGRLHTRSPHCLLGGEYTEPARSRPCLLRCVRVTMCPCVSQAFHISSMFKSSRSELSLNETLDRPLSPHHTVC